ncbi:MAG: sensor protein [Burkholderiales bacterium PBB5]|nr:MAG: sensor protein [Burkholderiales bacterium PBB5]
MSHACAPSLPVRAWPCARCVAWATGLRLRRGPMRQPETRSLRLRLLMAMAAPVVAVGTVGVYIDFMAEGKLIGESHDRALASTAIGLAARLETDRDGDLPAHLVATMRAVSRLGESDALDYLVVDGAGQRIAGDLRLAPLMRHDSVQNPSLTDADFLGRPVRVVTYAYAGPDGRANIVVAEALDKRLADARRVLLPTAITNLLMALAMSAAAAVAVSFARRPRDALGQRVEGHEAQALRPMRLRGLPRETRPLARALNRLMARLRQTTQARQDFIDNTAHQLRTPLTGLQAQLALLEAEPLSAPVRERVQLVQGGVQRLAHLTHQLLALARGNHVALAELPRQDVALPDLLQQVASACLDAALNKGIDLGFDTAPATVHGTPWMLRELLVNLVDNAIQHAPAGATVTVRCGRTTGGAFLEVEDDGPGIPLGDRSRVFERHVRLSQGGGHGTGLGLAIVREIAASHQAQVTLGDRPGGPGLLVRVDFTPPSLTPS